jgi:hypothetical protein
MDKETKKIIQEIKETEILKKQLKDSVWKPKITTRISKRDRQPKRKLLINIESYQFDLKDYEKTNKLASRKKKIS